MATKPVRLSEEEEAVIARFRESKKAGDPVVTMPNTQVNDAHRDLANAFVEAIERTKPPTKKTVANRPVKTPWYDPAVHGPRLKLKRKMFHHGILLDEKITNETISLLNKIKPGSYCNGYVTVRLRKDRGLDIDHPVRTAAQRLKLGSQFGITSFDGLLQRLIAEKENPSKYRKAEDADLYDLE